MTRNEEGELIGTGPSEVVIREASTDIRIELAPGALATLAARITAAPDRERIYLTLEGIRGTQAATTLTVCMRLPDDDTLAERPEFLAGTAGLYGIRRASVRTPEHAGEGLRSTFDVTRFFRGLERPIPSSTNALVVAVRLRRELPASASIVIGRVALFHARHDHDPR